MNPLPTTILVIDDNQNLLDSLVAGLRDIGGYTVYSAADGASGLEQCVALMPACVIVDIMMPGLDGYQFVRALRGDPDTAHIPLVILTALAQDHEQFRGLAAGADQYLTKPVRLEALFAAIGRAIDLSQESRDEALRRLAEGE